MGVAPSLRAATALAYPAIVSLAALYVAFLESEGLGPEIDEAGDVMFRCEGDNYWLMVDDDDPAYFRLLFPNFWSIESPQEHQRALLAAAEVTAEIKVAKVYVLGDDTQAAAEMFLAEPADLHSVFARALRALQGAVLRFAEIMQERRSHLRLVHENN